MTLPSIAQDPLEPVASVATSGLPSPLDAVADMRAAARWTAAAVGAVGATLIAGVPLTALGRIENTGDAVAIAIGLAIAMVGVAWAIWHISEALTPPVTSLATYHRRETAGLRNLAATDPSALFGQFGDLESLRDALRMRRRAVAALEAAVARNPTREILVHGLEDARVNLAVVQQTSQRLLALMHAWQVRAQLRRARVHAVLGMLVVTVGVAIFLSATPEPPPEPAKSAAPSAVAVCCLHNGAELKGRWT
ncbi:hypothetical protein ACQP2E_20880 [Actinoplanes sp. CA-015351]|uniref:hypothetical protein n=1 Tax=Actinoplanes sp. CA-015351 TaxID=3239897 RepID=UPI003D96C8CD